MAPLLDIACCLWGPAAPWQMVRLSSIHPLVKMDGSFGHASHECLQTPSTAS